MFWAAIVRNWHTAPYINEQQQTADRVCCGGWSCRAQWPPAGAVVRRPLMRWTAPQKASKCR